MGVIVWRVPHVLTTTLGGAARGLPVWVGLGDEGWLEAPADPRAAGTVPSSSTLVT